MLSTMDKVAIVAYETSKFIKQSDASIFELSCQPCIGIFKRTAIDRSEVDALILSSCCTDQYSSTIISEMLRLRPRISYRVDNLCNSGTAAIISAFSHISAGLCDCALVVGAEKSNNTSAQKLQWDITRGCFNLPIHWASIFARSHMRNFGTTEEQMAMVSVKNHKNSSKNPTALFNKEVTLQDVMNSRMISEPIKLLDCSSICEGSSALLLVSKKKVKQFTDNPVWIKGIGHRTTCASFSQVATDLVSLQSTRAAAEQAYKMSQTNPKNIDIAELHDAFTIMEILAYEDLFFTQKGEGGKFVNQEKISVNPRGGILGCGHPIGATGIAQTVEIAAQLTGRAGKTQVKGCKTGLVHNMAAAGSSSSVIILGT